jgi:4-hydroxy-tetrahydrodipicolinate reductase
MYRLFLHIPFQQQKSIHMKIILIGYGKMGKAIEEIALNRGHSILLKIDKDNVEELTPDALKIADVAIEFTGPESAFDNINNCLVAGLPVVSGSTGWLHRKKEAEELCLKLNGKFLYASNFSIGVNLFFELNQKLAVLMAGHPEYRVSIQEIHHTQKLDAPSGTAISLAEQIMSVNPEIKNWVNHISDKPEEIAIISERTDPAPGTHSVFYRSAIDDIEIRHTAHNRKGFALGAVLAAEFLFSEKVSGIYGMKHVLTKMAG